jgi:ribonuclease P protein component
MQDGKFHTIKKRSDFLRLSREGKKLKVCPWLIFNYSVEEDVEKPALFVGWTVPKRVGNAVFRNKLKRWAREFFRKQRLSGKQIVYLNIVIREQRNDFLKGLTFQEFTASLEEGWGNLRFGRKKAFDDGRSRI